MLAGAGVLALAGLGPVAGAAPASGAVVAVTGDLGEATASDAGPTTVQIAGSGFQSVPGGFGGVYVMFGWVAGEGWQPSAGGVSGEDYLYVPDVQSAENAGHLKFVSFPDSTTSEEANGGVLAEDGTFATELIIPGPVVELSDAAGNGREVDCRVETCGILTFGAHGVINANNETFTPVTFVAPGAAGGGESTPTAEESAAEPDSGATVPEASEGQESASGDVAESEEAGGQSEVSSEPGGEQTSAADSTDGSGGGLSGGAVVALVVGGVVVVAAVAGGLVALRRRPTD